MGAPTKSKPTKDELERLYMQERISPESIGQKYNVAGRTVRTWMRQYGIPRLGNGHLRKGVSATWNIGLVRSKETRQKNGLANLGREPPNKGQGDIQLTCKVCGKTITTKPYYHKHTCSGTCKNRYMSMLRGKDHWNYKGETAGFRQRRRGWIQYKEWRAEVLKRDNYICLGCKTRSGPFTAHHLYSFAVYPEHRYDVSNGVTLCWPCHWAFHRASGHKNTTPEMFHEWLSQQQHKSPTELPTA